MDLWQTSYILFLSDSDFMKALEFMDEQSMLHCDIKVRLISPAGNKLPIEIVGATQVIGFRETFDGQSVLLNIEPRNELLKVGQYSFTNIKPLNGCIL